MAYPTITFGSAAATGSSNTIVITKPTGAQVGDVFIVFTYTRTQYPSSAATGWTSIGAAAGSGANPETQAYYKVCDGTEGSTFTFPATSYFGGTAMIAYVSGADTTNPIDTWGQTVVSGAATTSSPPGVTTTSNQSLLVYGVHAGNGGSGTLTAPGDVTALNISNGTYSKAMASSNGPASPGTVSPSVWTASIASYWANMTVVFRSPQAANQPPTASITASTSTPSVGDTITFNSNAADPENGTLTYVWTLPTRPNSSGATVTPNGSTATLVPDLPGTYAVRCVVTDDHNQSVTVNGTVTVVTRVRTKLASGTAWTKGIRRGSTATAWQNSEVFTPGVTMVGKSATASSYATSLAPSLPTGIQTGDVMYALVGSNNVTITAPSGWTALKTQTSSSSRGYIWRKVAGAGETAPTFTMTGSNGWGIALYVFRGVNATTPEASVLGGGGSASRETTLSLINVPTNGCAGIYAAMQSGVGSNTNQAFNVAKTDYSLYTDTYGRFISGSETNMPAGTVGRSIYCENLGNVSVVGVIIQP